MLVRVILCWLLLAMVSCGSGQELTTLPSGARILAFGDSLTFGIGVPADQSYPAVLAELTGFEVVRSGVPGEISAVGLRRLQSVLDETSPALVIICHGGNDVLRRLPVNQTAANLESMIRIVQGSGSQVVVLAVPKPGIFPASYSYYDRLDQLTGVVVEYDLIRDLQMDASMKSDPIHFNRQGYRKMAQVVHDLLVTKGAIPASPTAG